MIHIVTDSAADIPPAWLAEWNIHVVPCFIAFGNESFLDGIGLTRSQFYTRLARCVQLPTSSAPSVGQFEEVYTRIAQPGDDILSIHTSPHLSSICNAARLGGQSVPQARV